MDPWLVFLGFFSFFGLIVDLVYFWTKETEYIKKVMTKKDTKEVADEIFYSSIGLVPLCILPFVILVKYISKDMLFWEWPIVCLSILSINGILLLYISMLRDFSRKSITFDFVFEIFISLFPAFIVSYTAVKLLTMEFSWNLVYAYTIIIPIIFLSLCYRMQKWKIAPDGKLIRNSTSWYFIKAVFFLVVAIFIVAAVNIPRYYDFHMPQLSIFMNTEERLKKKVDELVALRQKLKVKQEQVLSLKSAYQSDIQDLTREIRAEEYKDNISTYSQAQNNSRVVYDLTLIQRKQAYISKLDETQSRLQKGSLELEFLEREVIDDLRIFQALQEDEVKTLFKEINTMISKYLPDAGKLAIEVDPNSMQTPEQIWQQINSDN